MQTTFIITFIGDDRPGLVEALSEAISSHDGNWLESRLSQLAGKFAGLISVSLPSESAEGLQQALKNLSAAGISVRVTECTTEQSATDHGRIMTLTVLGPDRPGIVREIAAALSKRDINVVDMESYVSSAPMSAELLFNAEVEVAVPDPDMLDELHEKLDQIGDEMDMHITLEASQGSAHGH
ncbi:MAG: ACT domain-containing protein [Halieaceae bacterium]